MLRNSLMRRNDAWAPFAGLSHLQRDIDSLFEDFMRPWSNTSQIHMPACDVDETDEHYLLKFDLPGVNKDEIQIEMRDNQLIVSGERKEERSEKEGTRHFTERTYGAFSRSFTLPSTVDADKIEASYKDGVLRLALPKSEAAKPKRIEIKEGIGSVFKRLIGGKSEGEKTKAA